jgi:hypothetical protein
MGTFSEETLKKFNEMCAAGLDFGEGPVYDFAMCLKSDGDIYGVSPGESCEDGKPISDDTANKIRSKKQSKEPGAVQMAKLKRAFIKKTGREMSKEEVAKAAWMINKGK